jgi:hypothetical protein
VKLETFRSVSVLGEAWGGMLAGLWAFSLALPLAGAAPSIGTAVARGSFRVDGATVSGNATLFEGAWIETFQSSSSLDLAAGPHLLLGGDSKGQIFGDRLILERGSGEMHNAAGFRVEARGLTVRTDTGRSAARISLPGATRVQVAALDGGLRVLNSQGVLVAALNPGTALEFEPQVRSNAAPASAEQEKFTGCLRLDSGHYLVTDEITNVTVELAGAGLDKEKGNHVQITGVMDPTGAPVSGATQYVRVSGVKRVGRGCPANKPAAAGAGGAPSSNAGGAPSSNTGGVPADNTGGAPANNTGGGAAGAGKGGGAGGAAGAGGGISATALAVIGGVVAAAVVGGLAATGSLSGSSSSVSR